jgi:hypothetical protein
MRGRLAVYGTFTGTGAAVTIACTFAPTAIIAWNETDGTTAWFWINGMADAKAFQATNNASTQFSVITTNGVTAGGMEVTFGSTISVNTKTIRYILF